MNSWIRNNLEGILDLFSILFEIENLYDCILYVFVILMCLAFFPFVFLISVIHDFLVFPFFRKDDV